MKLTLVMAGDRQLSGYDLKLKLAPSNSPSSLRDVKLATTPRKSKITTKCSESITRAATRKTRYRRPRQM